MVNAVVLLAGIACVLAGATTTAQGTTVLQRAWPVLLFLIFITIVAELCDEAGLFDLIAHWCARVAGGRRWRLFALFCGLAVIATWTLSLDTTAVLLTPIAISLADEVDVNPWPFAFACVWLANGASLLLPVANLSNLLATERLQLGLIDFAAHFALPQLAVLTVMVGVLAVRYRASLRGTYPVPTALPGVDRPLAGVAAVAALGMVPALAVGLPAWLAAGCAAALLLVAYGVRRPAAIRPRRVARLVPGGMVAFVIGLFLLVEAVMAVVGPRLGEVLHAHDNALPALGLLAAVGTLVANVVNNLPAYLALEPYAATPERLGALLVATNVGPVVLLWGSLANLLWRERCRARGLSISLWRFALEGLLVVPLAVTLGVLALVV